MKIITVYVLLVGWGLMAGCTKSTRGISNSGYEARRPAAYCGPAVPEGRNQFHAELSEFDVLGIMRGQATSENEIRRALLQAKTVRLRKDSSILLIQSGAVYPDGTMMEQLGKHFRVVPFSGVPGNSESGSRLDYGAGNAESYSKSLRLAAARGGNDFIVCYWGIIESENEKFPTKTISWVPGVNWMLPDEKEHMRIKLKFAIVDVASGDWTLFSPREFEQARTSISPRRAVVDQKMVEALKKEAYATATSELLRLHSELALNQ
jgi:hypothetical protein